MILFSAGHTLEEEQQNIIIRGVGNATIDGGLPNGINESTSNKGGLPHIEKNNVISNLYMSNVIEEDLGALTEDNGKWTIKVKPHEIITLGVKSH